MYDVLEKKKGIWIWVQEIRILNQSCENIGIKKKVKGKNCKFVNVSRDVSIYRDQVCHVRNMNFPAIERGMRL